MASEKYSSLRSTRRGFITGSTMVGTKMTPNFLSTSSTNTRDRVRAVVQLILMSPEYAIQR